MNALPHLLFAFCIDALSNVVKEIGVHFFIFFRTLELSEVNGVGFFVSMMIWGLVLGVGTSFLLWLALK